VIRVSSIFSQMLQLLARHEFERAVHRSGCLRSGSRVCQMRLKIVGPILAWKTTPGQRGSS
jgi:hypothetical protein